MVKTAYVVIGVNLDGEKEVLGIGIGTNERCIIYQIRSSMKKYVPYKDKKAFVAELKSVYNAVTESIAMEISIKIKGEWDSKYPHAMKIWEDN